MEDQMCYPTTAAPTSRPVALITGAGGQDGAYLVELLREHHLDYEIHVVVRTPKSISERAYAAVYQDVTIHYGSVNDACLLRDILKTHRPHEVYNLAGQSHVAKSWDEAVSTCEANGLGFVQLLEALRVCGLQGRTRVFQAGTSELFGHAEFSPQNEDTPFAPTTPYATSKAFAFWIARNYRERYGMFIVNGILFNHESPRRGSAFRTWRITQQVAEVFFSKSPYVLIGNPETRRDWGHVSDFVRGMWLSLQHDKADDYVFATGASHSIREFVERSFGHCNIKLRWTGEGVNETAQNDATGQTVVRIDPEEYFRASHDTLGDPKKLEAATGWKKTEVIRGALIPSVSSTTSWETTLILSHRYQDVVSEMVEIALKRVGGR